MISTRPHGTRRRWRPTGVTLIEVLIALPLVALLVAMSTLLLFAVLRGLGGQMDALAARLETRRAADVVSTALAPLRPRDLVFVSDTLLEVAEHQAVGVVCGIESPTQIVILWPDQRSGGATIRVGDVAELWGRGNDAGSAPHDLMRVVRAIRLLSTAAPVTPACGRTGVFPRSVITVDSLPATLLIGAPVLVRRHQRWLEYRSASRWWIGRRSFDGLGWDGTQPVAGPIGSSRGGGLLVSAWRRPDPVSGRFDGGALLRVAIRRHLPTGGDFVAATMLPLTGGDSTGRPEVPPGSSP